MNANRSLIPLLLAALAAADFTGWVLEPNPHRLSFAAELWLGLLFAQAALLIIWICLGSTSLIVRVAVFLSAAALVVFFLTGPHSLNNGLVMVLGMQIATISIPLMLLRCVGVAVAHEEDQPGDPKALQFSLRQMIASVTAVGVLLGFARTLNWSRLSSDWFDLCLYSGSFALTTLVGVWACLGTGPTVLRLSMFLFCPLSIACLMVWRQEGEVLPVPYSFIILTLFGMYALVVGGSLGVFRLAGYQLRRRTLLGSPTADKENGNTNEH